MVDTSGNTVIAATTTVKFNSGRVLNCCRFHCPSKDFPMLISLGQDSLVSLVWKETQSRIGAISTRLDLSPFDGLVGFQWASRSLNPPQWRSPKKKGILRKQRQFVLPGFDFPSSDQTRITATANAGILSGFELRVRSQYSKD